MLAVKFYSLVHISYKFPHNFKHLFFLPPAAFCADLVALPSVFSFLVTFLITPTATVCLMSRTANCPSGAYSTKDSTTIGLDGTSPIMAASPDFTIFGFSSRTLPDRRSIFCWRTAQTCKPRAQCGSRELVGTQHGFLQGGLGQSPESEI